MIESVAKRSREQGYKKSRLPRFTLLEKLEIYGSADFLGLNHYITVVNKFDNQPPSKYPNSTNDLNEVEYFNPNWTKTEDFKMAVKPDSLTKLLLWVGNNVNNKTRIVISENGYAGNANETFNDQSRIDYLNLYLQAVLDAMNQGANVDAYTWWSLMDNFEWTSGYT